MAARELNGFIYDAEHCRELLSALPGVFAAGVRFEEDELVEIHVLAANVRSPKQIARDVQSALFATYGVEVDHRIVSIAQLPQNPFGSMSPLQHTPVRRECPQEVRLVISSVDVGQHDGLVDVGVSLMRGEETYTGRAQCRDTRSQRPRAAATAALNAVHAMLGKPYFDLLEVRPVVIGDACITVTIIEFMDDLAGVPVTLTGAAVQHDDVVSSAVRSTLDALNRCIGRLCRAEMNS